MKEDTHKRLDIILLLLYEKSRVNTDAETENRLIITRATGEENGK